MSIKIYVNNHYFLIINKVPDINSICMNCDSTCSVGNCSIGNDSTKCKSCKPNLFLNSTNSCVTSTNCPIG